MNFVVVGTNYKYAPLPLRERFSFSKNDCLLALQKMFEADIVRGAVILSTCQRVEVYAEADYNLQVRDFLFDFKKAGDGLRDHFYIKRDVEAILHLFGVAAGLDSQSIGENEILRQVKEAYFLAKRFEATTPFLNKVFERALFTGKLVRQNTHLSGRDPSIASTAVELAQRLSKGLAKKNIFVIGAGVVANSVAVHCASRGARCIIVAGRTFNRAQELAVCVGGETIVFDEFYHRLDEADILFSATASPHLILQKEVFQANRHSSRPMLLFDLACPRDIDPRIAGLGNARLFNVDDLVIGSDFKNSDIQEALSIVGEKAGRFIWKLRSVSGPVLSH
ncbi:MAG: glutamyl-tRNA reductase [Candidatus Omnitrophica bacterium]|nr:glutamyl-tRNA reductase [Candidatus Omnitrophota bacterium]